MKWFPDGTRPLCFVLSGPAPDDICEKCEEPIWMPTMALVMPCGCVYEDMGSYGKDVHSCLHCHPLDHKWPA